MLRHRLSSFSLRCHRFLRAKHVLREALKPNLHNGVFTPTMVSLHQERLYANNPQRSTIKKNPESSVADACAQHLLSFYCHLSVVFPPRYDRQEALLKWSVMVARPNLLNSSPVLTLFVKSCEAHLQNRLPVLTILTFQMGPRYGNPQRGVIITSSNLGPTVPKYAIIF